LTQVQTQAKSEAVTMKESAWSMRFIWAAIIQGLFAVVWTVPIVDPYLTPAVATVIASGSAGTWFLVGYVMYIVVGVIAPGLTALFYYHFEVIRGKAYKGLASGLAWVHLICMNVGAAGATWLLMYGGYFGERGVMTTAQGGLGLTAEQVHVTILSPLVNPIGYLLILTAIGVLAGGLGFMITYFGKPKPA